MKKEPALSKVETEALIEELKEARDLYYGVSKKLEENPELTSSLADEEYDLKLETLEGLEEVYPELFSEGTDGYQLLDKNGVFVGTSQKRGKGTVRHNSPMLSLAKAKDLEAVEKFYSKVSKAGADSFKVQAKLDGFALSLIYENGKLKTIASRGDGTVGDDFTYLLEAAEKDPNFTLLGLPGEISTEEEYLEVRGEIIISRKSLEEANKERTKLNQEPFKNERNAIVGLIKKAEKGLPHKAEVEFISYSALKKDTSGNYIFTELSEVTESNKDSLLDVGAKTQEAMGEVSLSELDTLEKLEEVLSSYQDKMNSFPFLVDGAVIKPSNEAEMNNKLGATSHHPSTQLAYKFPTESGLTTVENITVSVGRTGRLTPTAELEPVSLDNGSVTVSSVSLHNFSKVKEQGVKIGSLVSITRANNVIPFLQAVISSPEDAEDLPVPTHCPECSEPLEASNDLKTVRCTNESCPSRNIFALYSAVRRDNLNLDGLAENVVDSLVESGKLEDIADFFTLTLEDLSEATSGTTKATGSVIKFGPKRAEKVLGFIEKAKTSTPYRKILTSLNIQHLGRRAVKEVATIAPTIEDFKKLEKGDLLELPLFGEVKSELIAEGIKSKLPLIEKLESVGFIFNDDESLASAASPSGTSKVTGLTFCISGAVPEGFSKRSDFTEYLESQGAVSKSGVNKDLDVLIADPEGTSSKVKKAKELGVKIVTAEDFKKEYLD